MTTGDTDDIAPGDGGPQVRLIQAFPGAPAPKPAARDMRGSIPLRAHRWCEPLMAASAYGWWLYAPMSFALRFDGHDLEWTPCGSGDTEEWTLLGEDGFMFPGFQEHYEEHAGRIAADLPYGLPFLTSTSEPGSVSLWLGVLAQTNPGWALKVQRPANLSGPSGVELLEGIVETDWYLGPVPIALRITRTDRPVVFDMRVPLMQVQPVHRAAYVGVTATIEEGLGGFSDEDWDRYRAVLLPAQQGTRGAYRSVARQRAKTNVCPFRQSAS